MLINNVGLGMTQTKQEYKYNEYKYNINIATKQGNHKRKTTQCFCFDC